MYSNIVKNLYIGKSKLIFEANHVTLPDTHTIGKLFFPTKWEGSLPDYGTMGTLWEELPNIKNKPIFEITPFNPEHKIYVTGIPKGAILDNFRIKDTLWSSYYEDNIRGYLFQVVPYDTVIPKLMIDNGSN